MPNLEVVEGVYQAEAQIFRVWEDGQHDCYFTEVDDTTIDAVNRNVESSSPVNRKMIAWVNFYQQAVVHIRHTDLQPSDTYGVPDFPEEKLYGERLGVGEPVFATGLDNNDCPEFQTESEVMDSQQLSPHMKSWLVALLSPASIGRYPSLGQVEQLLEYYRTPTSRITDRRFKTNKKH